MDSEKESVDGSALLKSAIAQWTGLVAIGSFVLYVCGYLALRFHLSVLGIATDLAVLDQRYLFTGARFLVYLASTLPSVLLVVLAVGLLGRLAWRFAPQPLQRLLARATLQPCAALWLGIAISLVAIQGFMRQSFFLVDLLLAPRLPKEPAWLIGLLVGTGPLPLAGYFDLLVASCLPPAAILAWLRGRTQLPRAAVLGRSVLAVLLAVQILLLPVNFGTLIIDKTLPQVTAAGLRPSTPAETLWLAWEGSSMTFLIVNSDTRRRSLLTLPSDKVGSVEIIGTHAIFPTLFTPDGEPRPVPRLEKP